MKKTKHAQTRCAQRGIKDIALDLLIKYGHSRYQKGGTYLVYLSESERKKLINAANQILSSFDRKAPLYCVVDDEDKIITSGWEYKSRGAKRRR